EPGVERRAIIDGRCTEQTVRLTRGEPMRYRIAVAAMALVVAGRPATVRAQDVPNRESALEVRKQFLSDLDTLQTKFLALAEAFPANKYSWRPAQGVRSVGEAFMH